MVSVWTEGLIGGLCTCAPSLGSGFNVMVSDCYSKKQMVRCSHTRASPVYGFWVFYQCCFLDFCNSPENRKITMH